MVDRPIDADARQPSRARFDDGRGRAEVWYAGPTTVHVQDEGTVDGALAGRVFGAVAAWFEPLPADTPRAVFLDHRRVTGVTLSTVTRSVRWVMRDRHPRLAIHLLGAELAPILRWSLWLLDPLLRGLYTLHRTVEAFDDALQAHIDPAP